MKNIFYLLVFLILLTSCHSDKLEIEISNKIPLDRIDEPVVVSSSDQIDFFAKHKNNQVAIVKDANNIEIPSQTDDTNGDGKIDEIVFVLNIQSSETKKISITWTSPEELAKYPIRTNLRFAKTNPNGKIQELDNEVCPDNHSKESPTENYQFEGPGWENDKVGFRTYFDPRNGFDIFGKKTSDMVLDKVSAETGNYHEMQDWGMDILKVGKSLGASGIAMPNADTLVRLGKVEKLSYKKITEGPVRSIFEINYSGWQVGDKKLNVKRRITIWAGTYYFQNRIEISNIDWNFEIVTGIVNLHNTEMMAIESNISKIIATFAAQTEYKKNDKLGMAIVIDMANYQKFKRAPEANHDILNTWLVHLQRSGLYYIDFNFYACWELSDKRFAEKTNFTTFLKKELQKRDNPLQIKNL